MHRALSCFVLLTLFVLFTPANAQTPAPTPAEALIVQVQKALLTVSKRVAQDKLPKLTIVEISLQTLLHVKGKAGLEFLIITLGTKVTNEETQTIKLTLIPPDPATPEKSSASDFSAAFADAIIAIALSVDKALKADPPLIMSKLEATIKFAVKREGGAGVKLDFVPVTLGLGASIGKSELHEIRVTFGK